MKTILAIGAHFDDIEIGCIGTLMKHDERGDTVYLAILNGNEYRTGDPLIRRLEQLTSMFKTGLNRDNLIIFEGKEDDPLVIGFLDTLSPDKIYIPFDKDTHQDHRRCSMIGQSIGRKKSITTMFYDSGTSYDFSPNLFSLIDFEKKLEVINSFKSQIYSNSINLDILETKERYYASLVFEGTNHAEGFITRKMRYM